MKIFKIFAILLFTTFFLNVANAQSISKKVATLDIQLILDKSTAANDVREKISKTRDLYQAQITKKEDELRAQDEDLSEKRTVFTPEKFNEERKKFTDQIVQVQREVQEKRSNLDMQSNYALEQIQGKILSITKKLALDKNIDLVLPQSNVFFARSEMDITQEVLVILDKEMPTIKLKTIKSK